MKQSKINPAVSGGVGLVLHWIKQNIWGGCGRVLCVLSLLVTLLIPVASASLSKENDSINDTKEWRLA